MRRTHKSVVDVLFTLALFCVFSATALGITLIGSKVYKDSTKSMEDHFNSTTAYSYLKEKIRQYDHSDGVSIEELDGKQVLTLTSKSEGVEFRTLIYMADQSLMELFVPVNSEVGLSAGQPISSIEDFAIEEIKEGLYKLSITGTDHVERDLYVAVQSDGGVQNEE